jgi:L-iditol 2-dehydrogenase
MKAMVLNAANSIALQDIPRPKPDAGQVLVRVNYSGICGTDLKIYQGGIPVKYPRVMGHESIGTVVEGGAGVKPGTTVIVDPAYSCNACYVCRAGQGHICPNGGLIGRDVDGGFAEYQLAPAGNVYAIPDTVDPADAALIQPMTTCLHGQRLAKIFPGEAVIVIGLGVTGLLHVQLAKAHGAYPVIGITRSQWKLDLARELGADVTIAPGDDLKDRVLEVTGGRGADLVIESVGKLAMLAQAIDLARIGGRILPFGIYTEKEGGLPFYDLYFKELNLINTRVAKPQDFPACIDFVSRGVVRLAPLITDKVRLNAMDDALELLKQGDSNRMKIIIDQTA